MGESANDVILIKAHFNYLSVYNCAFAGKTGINQIHCKYQVFLCLHCACCTSVCVPLTVIPPAEPAVSSCLPPVATIVFSQSPTLASPAGWSRLAADAQQMDTCSGSPQEHASYDATCIQNIPSSTTHWTT